MSNIILFNVGHYRQNLILCNLRKIGRNPTVGHAITEAVLLIEQPVFRAGYLNTDSRQVFAHAANFLHWRKEKMPNLNPQNATPAGWISLDSRPGRKTIQNM